MSGDEAIVPRQFVIDFKKLKTEQESMYTTLLNEDEQIWNAFYESPAFRIVKRYIEKLIDGLDELEGQAFESGADLSEIGLRRAVNRLTRANLMSLVHKVEQTHQVIHDKRKKSRSK